MAPYFLYIEPGVKMYIQWVPEGIAFFFFFSQSYDVGEVTSVRGVIIVVGLIAWSFEIKWVILKLNKLQWE